MRGVVWVFFGAFVSFLTACGSSDTPVTAVPPKTVPPLPSPPIALLEVETRAAHPNSSTILSASALSPQAVVISEGVPGDGNIQVTVGATDYELTGAVVSGTPVFTGNALGMTVSASQVAKDKDGDVILTLVKVGSGASIDPSGYSVLGDRTTLEDMTGVIAAATKIAEYKGTSYLVATHEDGYRDDATGDLQLDVDFLNSIFSGQMDLSSGTTTGGSNFEISDVNATIFGGVIAANGDLTAVVDVNPGDLVNFPNGANQLGLDPLSASSTGSLIGGFYGSGAKEAGGTFSFSGDAPSTFIPGEVPKKIVVQGGFLGKK